MPLEIVSENLQGALEGLNSSGRMDAVGVSRRKTPALLFQYPDILRLSLAVFDCPQYLFNPPKPFPAGCAPPA